MKDETIEAIRKFVEVTEQCFEVLGLERWTVLGEDLTKAAKELKDQLSNESTQE